jgi:CDP-diacylglycerol---serine O-phosphatidyltransferase
MKKHIPNFLTCCNLFCGCVGIILILQPNGVPVWDIISFGLKRDSTDDFKFPTPLAGFITIFGLALFFDFSDGFAARLLNVTSNVGKDLDSLADTVTFGALPGIIIYKLLLVASFENLQSIFFVHLTPYFALLIPVFSAIRLAKFNNDFRQKDSFIGVPTPANATLIASFYVFSLSNSFFTQIVHNLYFLLGFVALSCFLLVSEIPMLALKFKDFTWKNNKFTYIFLALSLILLVFLQFLAVPCIFVSYIILSLIKNTQKT